MRRLEPPTLHLLPCAITSLSSTLMAHCAWCARSIWIALARRVLASVPPLLSEDPH